MTCNALKPRGTSRPQGMDYTTDKLRSLVRKWQTLIEAYVDVKTTDGYFLRMFCLSFTKKRVGQVKKTCYAQASQVRAVVRVCVFKCWQAVVDGRAGAGGGRGLLMGGR